MYDLNSENEFEKIRSLAKFYESIPDYYQIHHLPEKEFNSVLGKLKENSLKLRSKSVSSYAINSLADKNKKTETTNSINILTGRTGSASNYTKYKDFSKRKSTTTPVKSPVKSAKATGKKCKNRNTIKKSYSLNQLYDEMQALELSNDRNFSPSDSGCSEVKNITFRKNPEPKRKGSGKKSKCIFSSNIPILKSPPLIQIETPDKINFKEIEDSPKKKKDTRKPSQTNCDNSSFLGTSIKKPDSRLKLSLVTTPSPVYPAARSNLAATLRAQISHKPHLECSTSPTNLRPKTRSKIDWEVKRTPGWKSLIYRETNKDDIMYRLATRRAEQKLQKQEYDMNMELMRQRVKSAPLLLERMTYWNPRLYNKSYHNCYNTSFSRLSTRSKSKKGSARKTKNASNTNDNNQFLDNDDLTSEDRAYL